MRTKAMTTFAAILMAVLFTSCADRLVGSWTVQRFETTSPGQQGVKLTNIGTVEFKGDGSGVKKISYSAMGVTTNDLSPFKWKATEGKYVTIESDASALAKTWIVMENKKKFQKWKSTEGSNIQTIELKK